MMKKKKGLKNYFISELAAAFIIEAEPLQKYLENRAAITENWVGNTKIYLKLGEQNLVTMLKKR